MRRRVNMFCMKCLKEKVDHQIKIGEMGYGSGK